MLKYLFAFSFFCLYFEPLTAQEGCPGCSVSLPAQLAADTAYLAPAPDAQAGVYYEEDISFRLPRTTTPVANETTPPGLNIDQITVNTVTNMPPGLSWEANQTVFDVSEMTDGCVRLCGTPLQPGFYEVEVVVTASVLLTSATTSFSFPIFVRQAVTETEGFTMINPSGCGETTVSFQNKIGGGGRGGFHYLWDFGNGNYSVAEAPSDQRYDRPGIYPVRYQAVIDTSGYTLRRIIVNEVGCDDTFNRPDLRVSVFDAREALVYQSETFSNAIPPLTLDELDIRLADGNYFIRVIDEDSGIDGGDDDCGIVNFNRYTSGKLTDTNMSVTINIAHPVDTVRAIDTVFVFAQPDPPLILADVPDVLCTGDTLQLTTTYENNIQWYRDSLPVLDGAQPLLTIRQSAGYWVQYTSADGCVARSDVRTFSFGQPPISPVFVNASNELSLFDEEALPRFFELQWFLGEEPIAGANQTSYCIGQSGRYALRVIDLETGCRATYQRTVDYDPGFPNCVSSAGDPLAGLVSEFSLFPNPASEVLWLEWRRDASHEAVVRLRDTGGRVVAEDRWTGLWGAVRRSLLVSTLPPGIYFLELAIDGRLGHYRVMKQ
jgi:hypothetical protein